MGERWVRDRSRRGDHSLRRFCHAYDGRVKDGCARARGTVRGSRGDMVREENGGARRERRVSKGERWRCAGFRLENRGGMFHETVLTACGKGRFAVTIQ